MRDLRVSRDRDAARLGAAFLELLELAAQIASTTRNSIRAERQMGEEALKALGVDTTQGMFQIGPLGQIIQQINGAWREME